MNYDEKCQLLIIGDSTVGKTSILLNYINEKFNPQNFATVGIDFITKDEVINDKIIRVKIWDTAGQERYKCLAQGFLRSSEGTILVYDVTSWESFQNLKFWIASMRTFSTRPEKLKMIILGNKIDEQRVVDKEEAISFAKDNKIQYFEVSAKTGAGVQESFIYLVREVIKNKGIFNKKKDSEGNEDNESENPGTTKSLGNKKKIKKKRKCNC